MEKLTSWLAHPGQTSRSFYEQNLTWGSIWDYIKGVAVAGAMGGASPIGGINVVVKVLGLPDGTQTQVTDTQFTFGSSES